METIQPQNLGKIKNSLLEPKFTASYKKEERISQFLTDEQKLTKKIYHEAENFLLSHWLLETCGGKSNSK